MPESGHAPLDALAAATARTFEFDQAAVYRPIRRAGGIATDFLHSVGLNDDVVGAWESKAANDPGMLLYDPTAVDGRDRNRAVRVGEHYARPAGRYRAWREKNAAFGDPNTVVRALVCDERGELLAWVGGISTDRARNQARLRALQLFAEQLQRFLLVDRKLRDAAVAAAGLVAALDGIVGPAVIAGRDGRIHHANQRARLSAPAELERIRCASAESIAAVEEGRVVTSGSAVRVEGAGLPDCWLVMVPEAGCREKSRVEAVAATWDLTPRQTAILHRIVAGQSNKTIGAHEGCAEVTVESHATAIFRKADVAGRTQLIAKVLTYA